MYYYTANKKTYVISSLFICFILLLSGCATNSVQPSSEVSPEQDISFLQKQADQQFRNGAYEDALVKYVQIIDIDQENEHAYVHIGMIHEQLKNYSLSEKAYNNALTINSQNIVAKEGLGICLLRLGKHTEAKTILEEVILEQPKSWKAQNGLGVIYDMEKSHVKALSSYNLALKNSPDNEDIVNNIGYSYYLSGDYRLAEEYFLRAIQTNNEFGRAWSNLGLLYARKLKYDESVIAFANVMEPYEAHNQVGYLSMLFGDYDVSELHLKKSILMAPFYYETAHKNLGRLKLLQSSLE